MAIELPRNESGAIDYEQLYYTAVLILGGVPSPSGIDVIYMHRLDALWANQFGFGRELNFAEWVAFRRWARQQQASLS